MKHVTLPGGEVVPSLGQGTWKMGERAERRSDEIAALRAGVELGMTLIDTAEMYGDGAAERLISEALGSVRDQLYLVSKAYPQNASRSRLAGACEASLKRLGTDRMLAYWCADPLVSRCAASLLPRATLDVRLGTKPPYWARPAFPTKQGSHLGGLSRIPTLIGTSLPFRRAAISLGSIISNVKGYFIGWHWGSRTKKTWSITSRGGVTIRSPR